jgi:hypothetical protein
VMKSQPVNSGNGMEDKTGTTLGMFERLSHLKRVWKDAKG